jgi:hypothetical protein
MKNLGEGAAQVRLSLSDTRCVRSRSFTRSSQAISRLLNEAEALDQLSRELHTKVSDVVSALHSNLRYHSPPHTYRLLIVA